MRALPSLEPVSRKNHGNVSLESYILELCGGVAISLPFMLAAGRGLVGLNQN